MHYVVFDLEWNGAGRANKVDQATQAAIPFEIIEIGAVKLDDKLDVCASFSARVRPRIYPILTRPVAAVTKRVQQSMKFGHDFADAARDFQEFCGDDYLFCTWSESDADVLLMNLRFYDLADQLEASCLDIQYLFDIIAEQADMQRSIEYAVDFLQLPKRRPFHMAVNDAWYTGQIMKQIFTINAAEEDYDLVERFAYDPNLVRSSQLRFNDLPVADDLISGWISQQNLACPACQSDLARQTGWQQQGKRLDAHFSCPHHGLVIGRGRLFYKNSQQHLAVTLRLSRDRDGILL